MNRHHETPFPHSAQPLPELAASPADASVPAHRAGTPPEEMVRLFARLMADESALYSVTRDWRYDSAGRKFVRLHALLDEQFTEIGRRLVELAACSRDLDLNISTGHGDVGPRRAEPDDGTLEVRMMRELLELHEGLLVHLRAGTTMTAALPRDGAIAKLLVALTADHEKDAFMLRALLWEVQNHAA
jgi:DNA-binding ferritin-like protein